MPTSDWCTCHVASDGALPGLRNVITRASRYCALATAPNRSGVAATVSARKWPMRAPAVNRTTPHRPLSRAHGGGDAAPVRRGRERSEEHTSELQSRRDLVCRLLLE